MRIAISVLCECRQAHPADMCSTSETSHMIAPLRFLDSCSAFGAIFHSQILLSFHELFNVI